MTSLDSPAYVAIVSKHTGPQRTRVLWKTTIRDARRVCSDPRTASRNSMLVWYSQGSIGKQGKDWHYVTDDGRFDALLAELDVQVTGSRALGGAA